MLVAISVSTNYDDILKIIISQNYKFLDKWYIITHKEDIKTIEVINKYNFENIEILYYNFYLNNKTFNKGGAIKMCQEKLYNENYEGVVLLLDSDIYLPDNLKEIMDNIEIKENTLYGTDKRFDYYSYDNFIKNKIDFNYPWSKEFQGYFQLYKFNNKYLYKDSKNCSKCDLEFKNLFFNKEIIKGLNVSHLGKSGVNWDGRNNKNDFIS